MVLERNEEPLKINEITSRIKELLEAGFAEVLVEGEISNFRPAASGHCYFSLKDDKAVLNAVLFRHQASRLAFVPENGQLVIARGRISVYAQRGGYQIVCDSLKISGEGSLLALIEERKRKLAEEGLFDESVKKPVPRHVRRAVVITSPTGAALRDILRVLHRREAALNVRILPALVQGAEAAEQVSKQIRRANTLELGDVILVCRGGGSLEDLLAFSEEKVVRAIAASNIPVVTGVGHEIDYPLCDWAADRRAATPSAAAELISVSSSDLEEQISDRIQGMRNYLGIRLESIRQKLLPFAPEKLERSIRLFFQPPYLRLDDAREDLIRAMEEQLREMEYRRKMADKVLRSASPYGILEKGYALIRDDLNRVCTDLSPLEAGRKISIEMKHGHRSAVLEGAPDEKL